MGDEGDIRPGMRVFDRDGVELGTIETILLSPNGLSARLVLSRDGLIVPSDIVCGVGQGQVQVTVGTRMMHDGAWDDPPQGYGSVDSYHWRRPNTASPVP